MLQSNSAPANLKRKTMYFVKSRPAALTDENIQELVMLLPEKLFTHFPKAQTSHECGFYDKTCTQHSMPGKKVPHLT